MGLSIGDNFKYEGAKFLDSRQSFATLEEMNAYTIAPVGFQTYCIEDDTYYRYTTTGWVPVLKQTEELLESVNDTVTGLTETVSDQGDNITQLWAKVDPLTLTFTCTPAVAEAGTTQSITLTFSGNKTLLTSLIDDVAATSPKTVAGVTASKTYTLKATAAGGRTASKTAGITFVAASYYGIVDDLEQTAASIIALTKNVKTTKALTYSNVTTTEAKRICYAYPQSLGTLTSIKDANNFDYINSYTRTSVTINSVAYYCYVLTTPAKLTSFKQVYA